MKKFCFKISIFLLPIVFYFAAVELYNRTKTSFSIKKNNIENNLNTIELLVFGSSHNQNAINPEFLTPPSCNMAFGGQPLSIDYFLLNKYIDRMPNLSKVCIEVSPHSFYKDLVASEWNGHVYAVLYNIKYHVEPVSIKNYSLVCSDYQFFSSVFIDAINPRTYKYEINSYGFVTNDFEDRFKKLNYDTSEINHTFTMNHTFDDTSLLSRNKLFVEKMIQKCIEKKCQVILLTPPFYRTYTSQIPDPVKREVHDRVKSMTDKYHLIYYDYSNDPRFTVRDFKNDNHLNSTGANKFTALINSEVLKK